MKMNKIIIFMLVLFGLVASVNAAADGPYDVANATYNGINLSVAAQDTVPKGMAFNNDGSKVYMIGASNDRIFEYDCSTDFDLDTCIYSTRNLLVSGQDASPEDMAFNNDGSKVYMIGISTDRIFEYDCSTNYKIDTCSYSTRNLLVGGQDGLPTGMTFNNDGSKVYMVGNQFNELFEYDCSTDYKIDTCSYSSRSLSVTSQDTFPQGMAFNGNGSNVFMVGTSNADIFQYGCTTEYDLDTCSYSSKNLDVTPQSEFPLGMTFNNDGSKVYIVANDGDILFEYSIDFPTSPTMTSNIQPFYNTNNISITLTNDGINNGSDFVEMLYSLDGASNVSLGNTTNTTFSLTNLSDALHNITFSLISNQGNSSLAQTFTIDTTNPVLSVFLPSDYNFYTGFNFSNYINVTDTNLDTCIITISGESSTICTDSDYDFTTNGNKTINVTATDLSGNTASSLNNIILINPFQSFQIFSNAVQLFNFTINSISDNGTGTAAINIFSDGLIIGSNSVLFEKLGFATTSINFTLNSTSEVNISTNVTESKIVIRIFDRENGQLLLNLTSIVIQATTGFSGNTTTGLLNISDINFISEQYQILAGHADYETETVYFNYNNQETINVDIFMLKTNSTEIGQITIIVKNSLSQFVESAVCSALEWRASESAFVSVAQGLSNVVGETMLNIQLNTVIYKFSCTKDTFTTITNAQIIQIDDSSLNIILNDVLLAPTTLFPNLVTSLTNTSINSTHQLITYNFADSDGLTTEACLNVYLVNGNRQSLNQQNCVSSATGTILLTVDTNQTSDILIQGALTTPEVLNYVTDSFTIKGIGDIAGQFKIIGLDVILPTILVLLGLGLGILLSKIEIAVVFVAIAGWVSVAFVPTIMRASIAMFISVVVGLMLWLGYNRK